MKAFKSPPRVSCRTLVLVSTLIAVSPTFVNSVLGQTDPSTEQTSQTRVTSDASIATQQANPQRTGVYRPGPTIEKGAIALESSKLFVMKRGSYESYSSKMIGSGPNMIHLMGGDIFWPYYGVGYSDPVVSGGVVYFSVNIGDGHLFALDAATGERKWHSKREKGSYSPPTVMGNTLYVGADDGYFYAVDVNTAKEKWRHRRTDNSKVVDSPAVYDGIVYYTALGTIYALDAETGHLKWSQNWNVDRLSTITVGDGSLYLIAAGNIVSLDCKSGHMNWNLPIKEGLWSPLVVANGLIYFRNYQGNIRAVDEQGQLQAKPNHDHRSGTRLTIDGPTIYFGGWSSGSTYALDATTWETKWKFSPGEFECRAPVVAGESVYLTCQDGRLYSLDAKTGKRRWSTSSKKPQLSSPVVTADAIHFISDDGKVYVVR